MWTRLSAILVPLDLYPFFFIIRIISDYMDFFPKCYYHPTSLKLWYVSCLFPWGHMTTHTFWLFLTLLFWSQVCVSLSFCEYCKITFCRVLALLMTVTSFATMARITSVQRFLPCDFPHHLKYKIRASHVMALTRCSTFRRFKLSSAWIIKIAH